MLNLWSQGQITVELTYLNTPCAKPFSYQQVPVSGCYPMCLRGCSYPGVSTLLPFPLLALSVGVAT